MILQPLGGVLQSLKLRLETSTFEGNCVLLCIFLTSFSYRTISHAKVNKVTADSPPEFFKPKTE